MGPARIRDMARELSKMLDYELEDEAKRGRAEVLQAAREWAVHLKSLIQLEWREELLQAKERFETRTIEELVGEGLTAADLVATVCGSELEFGRQVVRFESSVGSPLTPDFRRGDRLIVTEHDGDPLRSKLQAQVLEITPRAITCLMRRRPQDNRTWRLDKGPNTVGYQRTLQGLSALEAGNLSAPEVLLRQLLELEQEQEQEQEHQEEEEEEGDAPRIDLFACLSESEKRTLNPAQRAALLLAERRHLTLIQGPPGCGKTRTSCALLKAAYRDRPLLAVADSNAAVDQLLQGLLDLGVEAVRVGSAASTSLSLRSATLDARLSGMHRRRELEEVLSELEQDISLLRPALSQSESAPATQLQSEDSLSCAALESEANHVLQQLQPLLAGESPLGASESEVTVARAVQTLACLQRRYEELVRRSSHKELLQAQVVCATMTSCGSRVFDGLEFDLVLMDEASQSTEPRSLIALRRLSPSGRLVIVGDQRQLPPVCICRRAEKKGLGVSLFDRMLARPRAACALLQVQYRMHPLIREWPSRAFYRNRLVDGVSAEQRRPIAGFSWPAEGGVAFLEAAGCDEPSSDGLSKLNHEECRIVCSLVHQLLAEGQVAPEGIGVITPYRGQCRLLEASLNGTVEVKTVDGFQGREKPVIIMSCVRSNPMRELGFLSDPRRLNVALTRAMCGLLVVGNRATLEADKHWRSWLSFVDARNLSV